MLNAGRIAGAVAAWAAAVTIVSGCGATGGQGTAGSAEAAASAPAAPTDPEAVAELPETGTYVPGDGCAAQAEGPWTNRTTDADLFAGVRGGAAPPLGGLAGGLDFEVHEYPTLDDYDDPSTFDDPRGLYEAWRAAGYEEGIDWRHGDRGDVAAVTLVRFRDDGGARAALSALLRDYCTRAVESKVLPDRSGMTVVRDSAAVRTMFVVDDIVVSVMSCACYGQDTTERKDLVEGWASQVMAVLEAQPDGTTS